MTGQGPRDGISRPAGQQPQQPEALGSQRAARRPESLLEVRLEQAWVIQPIPAPEQMAGYRAIQDDFPERLMSLAEQQAKHRRVLESHIVRSRVRQEMLGLILGFVAVVGTVGGAFWIAAMGQAVAGVSVVIAVLVGLVGCSSSSGASGRRAPGALTLDGSSPATQIPVPEPDLPGRSPGRASVPGRGGRGRRRGDAQPGTAARFVAAPGLTRPKGRRRLPRSSLARAGRRPLHWLP